MYLAAWNTPQVERLRAQGHAVYYGGDGWYHSTGCLRCLEDRPETRDLGTDLEARLRLVLAAAVLRANGCAIERAANEALRLDCAVGRVLSEAPADMDDDLPF